MVCMSKFENLLKKDFLIEVMGLLVLFFWFDSIDAWNPLKISLIVLMVLLLGKFLKNGKRGDLK